MDSICLKLFYFDLSCRARQVCKQNRGIDVLHKESLMTYNHTVLLKTKFSLVLLRYFYHIITVGDFSSNIFVAVFSLILIAPSSG